MPYLAMTASELKSCKKLPDKLAWMACHFSPYGTGLTNLPEALPQGALLILNDRTPIHGHDPERIFAQLGNCVEAFKCEAVLLDLQRSSQEAQKLVKKLLALPCPVAVSLEYARDLPCPIFLPPVPMTTPLEEYLSPWKGREIWLEAALEGAAISVTEKGSILTLLSPGKKPECPHYDRELFCHYRMDISADSARFTICRTKEDLAALMEEAKAHGVTTTVGLYQELGR